MARGETLGECLQRLRLAAGLTQDKLAEATGLSIWNVRNWEQGNRVPGLAASYKLAKALGMAMEELAVCAVEQEGKGRKRKKD